MILVTAGVFAVNVWGVINLKQNFDITLFLPKDSYSYKFRIAREHYFPDDGLPTSIYCSECPTICTGNEKVINCLYRCFTYLII